MKRPILLYIAVFGLCLCSLARPVSYETAKVVAAKFMATNDLQLVSTYQTAKNNAAFYIFNTTDGFVIVAADDCETPIIAYSHEGRFDPDNVPVQMQDYLQDFAERIQYGIENHITAGETTARQWELAKTIGRLNDHKVAKSVAPLLTSKWHQGCLYNSLCPAMTGPCDHAEVGCVAVAMGQIMHYWKYPTTGWGSHSYSNAGVTLSADFGNTSYDWDHMPDSLTENSSEAEIEAVATLLYHCGVSVKMKYSNSGSITSSGEAPNAMMRYFDYSRQITREKRTDYDVEEWLGLLKSQLDQQLPVLYSGYATGSGNVGHAFVCDGYDENDMFHFNWGWGGTGDGFFALGNLNPNGYDLNDNHYAIINIIPQYDPYHVEASAYPASAGTIGGAGYYHLGEECTLTATPVENSKFDYWKKDGKIVSYDRSYSFLITNDVEDIEAYFSYKPVKEITACHAPDTNDVNSPYVSLSWNYDSIHEWKLLKQFEIDGEDLVTTNDQHIYTAHNYFNGYPYTFGKYTMDGELKELFNIDGASPDGLTCDGNYFYCSKNLTGNICYLHRYDFENKTLIDSTYMSMQFSKCVYDTYYDGFWLLEYYPGRNIFLVNRQGQTICSTRLSSMMSHFVTGFGGMTAEDGNRHMLLFTGNGVYDFDISNNSLNDHYLLLLDFPGHATYSFIGKYDGKDAAFVIGSSYDSNFNDINCIYIFEISYHLSPILHYRLYRTDNEGHTVMLADKVTDTSYTDLTWNSATAGLYRFGISEVYFNGSESEIIWSDTLEKTDFGIEEDEEEHKDEAVMKVIENGHIVIIKDGKRYSVTGQRLN